MGFIDTMKSQGHAVESVCRVLREQGLKVAARTYRSWKQAGRPVADRTISDARVMDAVRATAWTTKPDGHRKLTPEGLYGRRKMTAYVHRRGLPEASFGAVDRAMKALALNGVRRDKGIRTTIPAKDGVRAGDLLDRDFTAPAPNLVWVTDFERHEALSNRVEVGPSPPGRRSGLGVAGGSLIRESPVRVEAAPTTTRRVSTARWPGLG